MSCAVALSLVLSFSLIGMKAFAQEAATDEMTSGESVQTVDRSSSAWKFAVVPQFHFLRVDAKDVAGNESSLTSRSLSPGVELSVAREFMESWTGHGTAGIANTNLQTFSSQDHLIGAQQNLWDFALGVRRSLSERMNFGIELGTSTQLFILRTGATFLEAIPLSVPEVGVTFDTSLADFSWSELGLQAKATHLMAASSRGLKTETGTGFEVALTGTIPMGMRPMNGRVYYGQRRHNANLEDWKSSELGFALAITLGGSER